jgi:hypothetical protein
LKRIVVAAVVKPGSEQGESCQVSFPASPIQ